MLGVADEAQLKAVRATVGRYVPELASDLDSLIHPGKLEHGGSA